MKITPEVIFELKDNEIFVFGSNRAGKHGAGAAKLAHKAFGAEYGVGEGLTGSCYALPTKDERIKTLPLEEIKKSFIKFLGCVALNPDLEFYLTKVGCGLAGYKEDEIAREFWVAIAFRSMGKIPKNLYVPIEFVNYKAEGFWHQ